MMKFTKRDSKKMIKEMARLHGLSVSEVREQIQDKIIAVMNSDDPDQQAEFRRMFGNSTTTPEQQYTYTRGIYLYCQQTAKILRI